MAIYNPFAHMLGDVVGMRICDVGLFLALRRVYRIFMGFSDASVFANGEYKVGLLDYVSLGLLPLAKIAMDGLDKWIEDHPESLGRLVVGRIVWLFPALLTLAFGIVATVLALVFTPIAYFFSWVGKAIELSKQKKQDARMDANTDKDVQLEREAGQEARELHTAQMHKDAAEAKRLLGEEGEARQPTERQSDEFKDMPLDEGEELNAVDQERLAEARKEAKKIADTRPSAARKITTVEERAVRDTPARRPQPKDPRAELGLPPDNRGQPSSPLSSTARGNRGQLVERGKKLDEMAPKAVGMADHAKGFGQAATGVEKTMAANLYRGVFGQIGLAWDKVMGQVDQNALAEKKARDAEEKAAKEAAKAGKGAKKH